MSDGLLGFQLLLHSTKQDILQKEDLLLLLVHHSLLKAGFKCAGNGETWNDNDTLSELLPSGWNKSKEYTLRYKRDEDHFNLLSSRTNDVIVFNFTCPEKMKVSNVMFNIEESVKSIDGSISDMVPMYDNVLQKITQELLTPFAVIQKVDMNTQTVDQPSKTQKERTLGSSESFLERNNRLFSDINSVGRRDLDPLSAMGLGGGMIFDPLREIRENRTRNFGEFGVSGLHIPPGARFDPFGPPSNVTRGRPPPDDDMFC